MRTKPTDKNSTPLRSDRAYSHHRPQRQCHVARYIEKGLEAGFFRYLTKPIKINEFMSALDDALKFAENGLGNANETGGQRK